jgi:hypothetical protein
MSRTVRIALGLALGALLATLPFLHFRGSAAHDRPPAPGDRTGGSHAHHAH